MQIFGRTFRRQEQPRSYWMIGLIVIAVLFYLAYLTIMALNMGQFLWSGYRRLPLAQRQIAGQVTALALGIVWFSTACVRWRHRLYLAPPMQDLVSTPARPMQILRLATRVRPFSLGTIYATAFVLFLYPWFATEWLVILTEFSWSNVGLWQMVFGAMCSIVAAALLMVVIDTTALCANLIAASIGIGGVAPHYTVVNYIWAFVRRPLLYGVLLMVGLMMFSVFVVNLPFPVPALTAAPLVQLGQSLLDSLAAPGTLPHVLMQYSPPVCWFDCIIAAVHGPTQDFQSALTCCLAWIGGSALLSSLCLNRALSVGVRAGWHGVGTVRPADASRPKRRRFDPDAINGPLERWLVERIGRMGRATLRLISRNPQAGAVDIHLQRTLLLCIPAALSACLAQRVIPNLLETFWSAFERSTTTQELHTAGQVAATAAIGLFAFLKFHIWGMLPLRQFAPQNTARSRDVFSQMIQQHGWLQKPQVTRGDNRYPLLEIYAIGFKDAVLLPTLYAMFWLLAVVGTSAIEALVVGLPGELVGWVALVNYLGLLQLIFLVSLGNVLLYTSLDYRRSWLLGFFQTIAILTAVALVALLLIVLIGFLWSETYKQNRFAVAVLGTVNILAIVNVVVYSLCRWTYLRRRFDCEINSGRRMY